jgi:hypothetical protein
MRASVTGDRCVRLDGLAQIVGLGDLGSFGTQDFRNTGIGKTQEIEWMYFLIL